MAKAEGKVPGPQANAMQALGQALTEALAKVKANPDDFKGKDCSVTFHVEIQRNPGDVGQYRVEITTR